MEISITMIFGFAEPYGSANSTIAEGSSLAKSIACRYS
jgi:hypothetical protein